MYIKTKLKDVESLKSTLIQFREQMREAYKTGELINKVPAFIPEHKSLFENKDILDYDSFKEYSRYFNLNDPSLSQMESLSHLTLEKLNRADFYTMYSHILVFQHALAHEELKDLVVEICKDIVKYAIEINSSNELFFSSDCYFGISILTTLCLKHKEYLYLIGEFVARNSDYNQIKYHVADHIYFLYKKYGYCNEMIKLFASIKFNELYICLSEDHEQYGNPDQFNLFKTFINDQEKYLLYKKELIKSFEKYPQNIMDDFDEEKSFIRDVFSKIIDTYDIIEEQIFEEKDDRDKDEEYESIGYDTDTFTFHGKILDDVIESFEKELFEAIKDVPRKNYFFNTDPSYGDETLAEIEGDPFYQQYEAAYDHEINQEFFTKGFSNGSEILNYIETGEATSVLQELKPVNIRKLCLEKKLSLYKRLEFYGSNDMQLSSDLNQDVMLRDILDSFVAPYLNADSYDLEETDEQINLQKAIRTLDVLIKICGIKQFTPDDLEEICDNLELLSEEELINKYAVENCSDEELLYQIYTQINDHFTENYGLIKLRNIHRLYRKNTSLFAKALTDVKKAAVPMEDQDILSVSPGMNQTEYALGSQLLSVAYIIHQELQDLSNMNHPDLNVLIQFYQENIFKTILWQIEESECVSAYHQPETKEFVANALDQLKNYLIPPTPKMPPKELIQKLMQAGMDSLTDEEKKIIKSAKPGTKADSISEEEALQLTEKLLVVKEKEEDREEKKNLIFHSDQIVMSLSSILYVSRMAPPQFSKQLLNAYRLILHTAPVKTLYSSFKDFIDRTVVSKSNIDELNCYEDLLLDLKIPQKYIFAFKILLCQKQFLYSSLGDFDDENELKQLYLSILEEYINIDKIDPDQSDLFLRREKQRKQDLSDSLNYLDTRHRLFFLEYVKDKIADAN